MAIKRIYAQMVSQNVRGTWIRTDTPKEGVNVITDSKSAPEVLEGDVLKTILAKAEGALPSDKLIWSKVVELKGGEFMHVYNAPLPSLNLELPGFE